MSIEDQLFLQSVGLGRESNINRARKKERKRLAGEIPKTVREYAEQNDISYSQALQELKQIGLGKLVSKKDSKLEKWFRKHDPTYESYAGKEDKELEIVDGYVVAKNRPKGWLGGLATLGDYLTLGLADWDRKGGGIGGMATGLGYRPEDYEQQISKKGRKKLLDDKVDESIEEMEFDVTGNVLGSGSGDSSGKSGSVLDMLDEYRKRKGKFERSERRKEMLDTQLNYMATEPIRQAFANKAAEAAAQRGLRIRAAKEAMPSNIQNIMLSKQAQMATAASSEAERARAAAAQQDAASRFAALGTARRFG